MGFMVDVSIGQHGGLCTLDFMNYLDEHIIKRDHLLKRSILLLKSFLTHELSLLGSQLACMATYGLYTLIIYIFNCYSINASTGDFELNNEMKVFRKFFEVLGSFKWDDHIITIFGPIRIQNFHDRLRSQFDYDIVKLALKERFHFFKFQTDEQSHKCLLFGPTEIEHLLTNYATLKLLSHCQSESSVDSDSLQHKFKLSMNLKNINIVDPCFSKNNLGKSISVYNSYRLKEAFEMRQKRLDKIYSKARRIAMNKSNTEARSYLFDKLCNQFKFSMECTGMLP